MRRIVRLPGPILMSPRGYWVVADFHQGECETHTNVACTSEAMAERVAELLDRHGLADVPEDASTLIWAPPDPTTRIEDACTPPSPR